MVLAALAVPAAAQRQLVPLVTDNTPLPLSNKLGITGPAVLNQGGDYAFIGNGSSALFLRRAGTSTLVPVWQMTDEVPGYPGSRSDIFGGSPKLNNSGLLAFALDFGPITGAMQHVILTFDGTSYKKVVCSLDPAPGGNGKTFGRGLSQVGLNDAGDVAFTAPLQPIYTTTPGQTTLYIAPGGSAPVRIAGIGDPAPGTGGGILGSLAAIRLNNQGEVLFNSQISGGYGGYGLFVGSLAGVRKVVVNGDPGFSLTSSIPALMNNSGQVTFLAGSSIYVNSEISGTTMVVSQGMSAPTPIGGTLGQPSAPSAFNDSGEIAFISPVNGPPYTGRGVFRYHPGNPLELVAYAKETVGTSLTFNTAFSGIAMNSSGEISFRGALANTAGGPVSTYGIYCQSGTDLPVPVAMDGGAPGLSGGGTYLLASSTSTSILDDGAVYFWADLSGGAADYGEFLVSGSDTKILMSTADPLPAGSKVVLRTFHVAGSGDMVGFVAQHTGGGFSIGLHNIATRTDTLVFSDGDVVDAAHGLRIRAENTNTVFVNSGGNVACLVRAVGGGSSVNAISLRKTDGEVVKIVAEGDFVPVLGTTISSVSLNNLAPPPLNDANQVVFYGAWINPSTGASYSGLFVGSPDAGIVKIVSLGDTAPRGGTFAAFTAGSLSSVSVNQAGQVAFLVGRIDTNHQQHKGVYIWTPPNSLVEVAEVGDQVTGGTISDLGFPSLNDAGEIVFMATLSGGSAQGGVFLASPTSSPALLALDGTSAPAGGNFSIASARPDVLINDLHDVLFRTDLAGGTSDSGYFVRRGASGPLQAAALQGQTAPGTGGGVFFSIQTSLNNLLHENFLSDSAGDVGFQARYVVGDTNSVGVWNLKQDNTLEEILVRGIVAPEFGGGAAVTSSNANSWNSGARYPLWARVSGGTFTDGILLSVPTINTPTPPGPDITVQPVDSTTATTPVTLTFDTVSGAGDTSVTTSATGPMTPSAFTLGDPPVFYDISTTAAFSGSITVCIDTSGISFPGGNGPRLLHFENGAWVDVTTSVQGSTVCGQVSSLSPFTVAQIPPMSLDVSVTPSVLWPPNNKLVLITANIQVVQPGAPAPSVALVSITSNEPLAPGDIQGAVLGTDCRSFQLRATRLGSGSGRTYAITYRATDFVHNSILKSVYVTVPHDQGK
jgi:hypothetical protein